MTDFQCGGAVVQDEAGDAFVRFGVVAAPTEWSLTLPPESMSELLVALAEQLPPLIAQARRMNAMKGFEVVQIAPAHLPHFPPPANGRPQ